MIFKLPLIITWLQHCQELGGELVSVNASNFADGLDTLRELALLNNFHKIWIGLTDQKIEGKKTNPTQSMQSNLL